MSNIDDLIAEFLEAVEKGEHPDREEMFAKHPGLRKELEDFFSSHDELFGAMNSQVDKTAAWNEETIAGGRNSQNTEKKQSDSLVGEHRIIGNYEILEEIDRGGMGIVFRALDQNLNRIVAVKMIRSGRLASESDIQRFNAEARAAAKLDHPGIVPVHEVGSHEGHPFFSMAFIEGENLDAYHKRKKLNIEEACSLIKEIALGIDHAHENDLVHRDLKPANILIDKEGRPRITDFGLAKSLGSDDGLTGTGEIIGTINYMAPEQAAARNDQVDRMTDIYSLGAMLYYLCTGRPPFETDNPVDTLLKILDSEPTLVSKVNPKVSHDVAVICMRCLEKDPKNRYQTAKELVDDIDRFLMGEPVEASKSGMFSRFRKWSRREPSLVGHLVGLGVIELTRTISYSIEIAWFEGDFGEYLKYTIIMGFWAILCVALQKIQNRLGKDTQVTNFVWSATDIGFLTLILLIVPGTLGPLFIAYPLVIVVSGFFSQVRLVAFTTALCVISYLIVFISSPLERAYFHYGVVGFAAIIAIGYVMCLLVHRIRLLNRLFE